MAMLMLISNTITASSATIAVCWMRWREISEIRDMTTTTMMMMMMILSLRGLHELCYKDSMYVLCDLLLFLAA